MELERKEVEVLVARHLGSRCLEVQEVLDVTGEKCRFITP